MFAAVNTHASDHKYKLRFPTKVEMVMSLAVCRKEKGSSHTDWGTEAHPERIEYSLCAEHTMGT